MSRQENQIFQYNGSPITFQKGNSVMVNATEMAKPFGKVAKDWLRTKQSQEFITSLSSVRQIRPTDLVTIIQGGNGEQGTWMHEDVALEFSRWLSPKFAIWCNDRIKEILTKGTTSISQLSRKDLALMVIQAEEEKERLLLENSQLSETVSLQTEELQAQAPKVKYVETAGS